MNPINDKCTLFVSYEGTEYCSGLESPVNFSNEDTLDPQSIVYLVDWQPVDKTLDEIILETVKMAVTIPGVAQCVHQLDVYDSEYGNDPYRTYFFHLA